MRDVLSVIMGGGRGTRLYPLTRYRSKPAVPVAGKYRLIDIPISNCLNSGYRKIFVLTQFNSVSLHRHVSNTYKFDGFSRGFVELLAAQQTLADDNWYQGTADAVRQNLHYFRDSSVRDVLILSGDQLYRTDFRRLVAEHHRTGADATIAVLPVKRSRAPDFGIMRLNTRGRVVAFHEKPSEPEVLDTIRVPENLFTKAGIKAAGREYLASMGIYCFKRDVLIDLLERRDDNDFGKEVFPAAIKTHKVHAHIFDGYWEDIGTIKSFHQANLEMAGVHPPFDFYAEGGPIFSHPRHLPGSRLGSGRVTDTIVCDGCQIHGADITRSVIGIRTHVGRGTTIADTVIMGADFYEDDRHGRGRRRLALGIGDNCRIENAIIDKNARIGNNVKILNKRGLQHDDQEHYCIRDGIVVVMKSAVLKSGTVI